MNFHDLGEVYYLNSDGFFRYSIQTHQMTLMAQIVCHILGNHVCGLSTTISHILEGLMSHPFDVVGDFK